MGCRLNYQVCAAIEVAFHRTIEVSTARDRKRLQPRARFHPALVELRVFQKYVECGRHRGVQAASAVAKTAADNIKIEKPPRRVRYHLKRRERVRLLLHRCPRAEPVHSRHVIRDVAVAEMQNRLVEPLEASFDYDLVMRVPAALISAPGAGQAPPGGRG